jgi:hypothetical protein
MVSALGEGCAIGWGIFAGLICLISCCEKITKNNTIDNSNFTSNNVAKDKDGKTITIQSQPYKNYTKD